MFLSWDMKGKGEKKKMKDVKKVSFRVRRIYYDQFAAGTKHEELRALKPYWIKILHPLLPCRILEKYPYLSDFLHKYIKPPHLDFCNQPEIAVVSCPGQLTLRFKITDIRIDEPEKILGRELSEQGEKDISTELCIVTKMGGRIKDGEGDV